ncbi:hypothetical protein [Dysgonomonas sp. GY617]|uniref:hypothetical protein n=1 Tax=Dysgonomonas sp. GY617 TaxID=2780420 RepID=UPI001884129D|nr:hypothetical protein [Dysgonomonas sp. GY617]MBF0577158.1 hypothetical protein [Dysgonomonas sp. GY617]
MERLIDTKLFSHLEKMNGAFNPDEPDIALLYNDFVRTVTLICTSDRGNVPAYFTMHYTRLELEGFQILLNDEGTGEKCPNPVLYYPLPVVPVCSPAMGRM